MIFPNWLFCRSCFCNIVYLRKEAKVFKANLIRELYVRNWPEKLSIVSLTFYQHWKLYTYINWSYTFRSPTYCASLSQSARDKKFQCFRNNTFGLIVHGLWPQAANAANVRAHPRNCRDEPQLTSTFVKRYFCIMPDEDLIQGEWEKHGKYVKWLVIFHLT